jgi:hypothetical protein
MCGPGCNSLVRDKTELVPYCWCSSPLFRSLFSLFPSRHSLRTRHNQREPMETQLPVGHHELAANPH